MWEEEETGVRGGLKERGELNETFDFLDGPAVLEFRRGDVTTAVSSGDASRFGDNACD